MYGFALLVGLAKRFLIGGALAAHTLSATTAVMPAHRHVKNLITYLTLLKLVMGHALGVKSVWKARDLNDILY